MLTPTMPKTITSAQRIALGFIARGTTTEYQLRRYDVRLATLRALESRGLAVGGSYRWTITEAGRAALAARASDDPAPTTPDEDDEPMTFDEVFRGASVVGVRRDAAPAAPEVPRG